MRHEQPTDRIVSFHIMRVAVGHLRELQEQVRAARLEEGTVSAALRAEWDSAFANFTEAHDRWKRCLPWATGPQAGST